MIRGEGKWAGDSAVVQKILQKKSQQAFEGLENGFLKSFLGYTSKLGRLVLFSPKAKALYTNVQTTSISTCIFFVGKS